MGVYLEKIAGVDDGNGLKCRRKGVRSGRVCQSIWQLAFLSLTRGTLTHPIQEQETLGIVPVFWENEWEVSNPGVPPMVQPG
jgi:hypothetical protein